MEILLLSCLFRFWLATTSQLTTNLTHSYSLYSLSTGCSENTLFNSYSIAVFISIVMTIVYLAFTMQQTMYSCHNTFLHWINASVTAYADFVKPGISNEHWVCTHCGVPPKSRIISKLEQPSIGRQPLSNQVSCIIVWVTNASTRQRIHRQTVSYVTDIKLFQFQR
jgi:hypothetical protein